MSTKEESNLNKLKSIEIKWQKKWDECKIHESDMSNKEGLLVTFPYPYVNGALHIGHSFTCNKVDIYARFKRLNGFNVLFPFSFHATGEPIVGVAKRIKNNDSTQINSLISSGVPKELINKFEDPEFIANYWREEATQSAKLIGWGIDWRRSFITIEPLYKKFIEWQYISLKNKGYIEKGTHNVIFCPACQSPTGDHDRLEGEGATPVQFSLVKFPLPDSLPDKPDLKPVFLIAATLRPETIYGGTNVWLNPEGMYSLIKMNDLNEYWIVSKTGAYKLQEQLQSLSIVDTFKGNRYLGIKVLNPGLRQLIPVLPAKFVDPDHSSGVVYSVPGHAPYDYLALRDLKENSKELKKYNISSELVEKIELINVVTTEGEFKTPFPGKEIVEQLSVKNQNDPKAEHATDIIYKKEFHKGVMSKTTGKYEGKKVSEIKDSLIIDFQKEGIVDPKGLWETSEIVICRSNDKCIVKTLQDQWFLDYGNPSWKEKTRKALKNMEIYPKEAISAFEYTINWLEAKACARKSGLGTKLPWDAESGWIVETLSDSTIYMALYTIFHKIKEFQLEPDQLTFEFFEYIFENSSKVPLSKLSKTLNIPQNKLKSMREEFNYWYPVALRISAKELIYNHLSFFLFQHIAIWDNFPEKWPKKIGAGGMLRIDNQKMSKSRGTFITLKEGLDLYGADSLRLGLAYADEGFDDPNFSRKETQNFIDKLCNIYEQFTHLPQVSYEGSLRHTDKWLMNRIKEHIENITKSYDRLETRNVVTDGFFNFILDLRWYLRREQNISKIYLKAIEVFILLLSPIIPHISEEIWSINHPGKESIFKTSWPQKDEFFYSEEVDQYENALKILIQDIKNLLNVLKTDISIIEIYVAESWKYEILEISQQVAKNELIKDVMKNPKLKSLGKKAGEYAKRVQKQHNFRIYNLNQGEELSFLNNSLDFLISEFKELNIREINIFSKKDDLNKDKFLRADPLRPAIHLK
ncbi:MAG: leucine--tRNA ligase [Candidatus Thorarchaeota archaeon]